MNNYYGLIFAFSALFCWSIGDFFIQKAVRKSSIIRSLFYIAISGTIVLLPFVWSELPAVLNNNFLNTLLVSTSVIIFFAAILDFQAMKDGKIAIIEPILSVELPIAVVLSIVFRQEILSIKQWFPIVLAFIGIVLTMELSLKRINLNKSALEKGVLWGLAGATIMGVVNFLIGVSSQETSALMAIWYTNTVIALICLVYIIRKKELPLMIEDFRKYPGIMTAQCLLDNAAWISYAFATTFIPISIATTISESYIAGTVLLGLFVNQEKIRRHQLAGIGLTLISILILSYNTIY